MGNPTSTTPWGRGVVGRETLHFVDVEDHIVVCQCDCNGFSSVYFFIFNGEGFF